MVCLVNKIKTTYVGSFNKFNRITETVLLFGSTSVHSALCRYLSYTKLCLAWIFKTYLKRMGMDVSLHGNRVKMAKVLPCVGTVLSCSVSILVAKSSHA